MAQRAVQPFCGSLRFRRLALLCAVVLAGGVGTFVTRLPRRSVAVAGLLAVVWCPSPSGSVIGAIPSLETPKAGVIVTGRLIDGAGRGVQGTVWLYFPRPSDATGRSLTAATATTDASGRFALSAGHTPLFAKVATTNDGWINFDLLAGAGHLYLYRAVTRSYVQKRGMWFGPGGTVELGTLVLARGQPGVALSKRPLSSGRLFASLASGIYCYDANTTVQTVTNQKTVVGELHTALQQQARFTYGTTADSNIGVGVSATGSGAWSVSGETHVGNSIGSTATWNAPANFHRRLLTSFTFKKRRTYNTCTGFRYTIKATAWNGGATNGPIAADPSKRCQSRSYPSRRVTFSGGSTFMRFSQRAVTYSGAVTVFGVSLSATSGYSTRVEVEWHFHAYGSLCGDTDFPPRAERIFAGN